MKQFTKIARGENTKAADSPSKRIGGLALCNGWRLNGPPRSQCRTGRGASGGPYPNRAGLLRRRRRFTVALQCAPYTLGPKRTGRVCFPRETQGPYVKNRIANCYGSISESQY